MHKKGRLYSDYSVVTLKDFVIMSRNGKARGHPFGVASQLKTWERRGRRLCQVTRRRLESPVKASCIYYYTTRRRFLPPRRIFSLRQTLYLDTRREVEIIRLLQRMQTRRTSPVVIRHEVLAEMIGCSESSVRRAVTKLVQAGHIMRTYITRTTKGGRLCVYKVRTDVIYRAASLLRRASQAIEQLQNASKPAPGGRSEAPKGRARKGFRSKNNNKYRRKRNRSVDNRDLQALMSVRSEERRVGKECRAGWA